jgi:hypothetical protein
MAAQSPNASQFVALARNNREAWEHVSISKKHRQVNLHNTAMITSFLAYRVDTMGPGFDEYASFHNELEGDEFGLMLSEFLVWAVYYRYDTSLHGIHVLFCSTTNTLSYLAYPHSSSSY